MFSGYIRFKILNGQSIVEVWKTINDESPKRISSMEVIEYAIKKDTFKVFYHFQGIFDFYKTLDAKIISRGKVNLYQIKESRSQQGNQTNAGITLYTYVLRTMPMVI